MFIMTIQIKSKYLLYGFGLSLLVLISSCDLVFPSFLEIKSFSPESSYVQNLSDTEIRITFSNDVSKLSVEKNFSLTVDSIQQSGLFTWESNSAFIFTPYNPLGTGKKHEIRLESACEDIFGNSMEEAFIHKFSSSNDSQRPELISIIPGDNAVIDTPETNIIIDFSEQMDPISILDNLQIQPAIQASYSFIGNTVIIDPYLDLSWQQEYQITVKENAADLAGNLLGRNFSYSFTIGTDTIAPQLISLEYGTYDADTDIYIPQNILTESTIASQTVNTGMESFYHLQFTFSEPIQVEGIGSRLSLEPPLPFTVVDNHADSLTSFVVVFDSPPVHGTEYQLILNEGYKDVQDNTGLEQYYYFIVDGINSIPPEVTHLSVINDPGDPTDFQELFNYDAGSDITTIANSFNGTPFNSEVLTYFILYLAVADVTNQDLYQIKWNFTDNFSVIANNSCLDFDRVGVDVISDGSQPATPRPLEPNEIVVVIEANLTSNPNTGSIDFTLNNRFSDGLDFPIADEWTIRIDK
jgi:hypothetical protein